MAVQATVDGQIYLGAEAINVVEDSTPIEPSDTTGGVGQFTFSIAEPKYAEELDGTVAEISDGSQGTTIGTISGLNGKDGGLNVTADSRLAQLNVDKQVAPYSGTLSGWFTGVLALCGITSGFVIDSTLTGRTVVYRGWNGNVWDNIKKMCVAEQVEVTLVSNNVVIRPLRQRNAENYRDSDIQWNLVAGQLAQSVQVNYYQNTFLTNTLCYPEGGWNSDVPVQAGLEAGAYQEFTYPLTTSLSSIQQPTCVSSVLREYVASSVYTVVGNDGLIIPPAQWAAGGGKVVFAIGDDTRSLIVKVTASSESKYAPYSIAMPSGTSSNYSSLRAVGTGVFINQQSVTMKTGVDPTKVPTEVGFVSENEFVTNVAQAWDLCIRLAGKYGSSRHTITVTTSGINRVGDTGSYVYPTIADFNALYAGMDINAFNAIWAGQTVAQFNAAMKAMVQNDFTNQAFGNVAGARVRFRDAMYRIRTATLTSDGLTYTAEEDTTIADFNAVWAGATIAQFNAQWAGKTFTDFAVAPLRRG